MALLAVLIASLLLAAPAHALPENVEQREQHRLTIAPGAVEIVDSRLGGRKDTVEVGIRHKRRWVPWKMFDSKALVWWRRSFTASAVSVTHRLMRVVVVNTGRRELRLRVVFDLLA